MNAAKALVRRLVDEVMERRNVAALAEVRSGQLAPKLRSAFEQLLLAFHATLGEPGSQG